MKHRRIIICSAALLGACSSNPVGNPGAERSAPISERPLPPSVRKSVERAETTPDGTALALSMPDYKVYLAKRISEVNSLKVYPGRPQALLRSVIVLKYFVDRDGNLIKTEVTRSNHDSATEATALHSLKSTAPFPKPSPALLRNGRVEISETWLFNNDGRFQLRSIAQPQMSE